MIPSDKPSPMVLAQRIRNRIIEYLELASSYEKQREYERSAPIAHVPSEVICQWEDWVDDKRLNEYAEPVFSPEEQATLRDFHEIWNSVADDTPKTMPPLSDLIGTEPWERLRQRAELTLRIFEARGRFNEEWDAFPK